MEYGWFEILDLKPGHFCKFWKKRKLHWQQWPKSIKYLKLHLANGIMNMGRIAIHESRITNLRQLNPVLIIS